MIQGHFCFVLLLIGVEVGWGFSFLFFWVLKLVGGIYVFLFVLYVVVLSFYFADLNNSSLPGLVCLLQCVQHGCGHHIPVFPWVLVALTLHRFLNPLIHNPSVPQDRLLSNKNHDEIANVPMHLATKPPIALQPVLHDWSHKGHGMCYPVCGMVHRKEPLLLTGKSSPCGSRFPLSLFEWSLTICLMQYNRK